MRVSACREWPGRGGPRGAPAPLATPKGEARGEPVWTSPRPGILPHHGMARRSVVLAARPLGESSAVVDVLTPGHGRHAGLVRGGTSRRMAPVLQPGTQVMASWHARRLDDHLGSFTLEPLRRAWRSSPMPVAGGTGVRLCHPLRRPARTRAPPRALADHHRALRPARRRRGMGAGLSALGTRAPGRPRLRAGPHRLRCHRRHTDLAYVSPRPPRRGAGAAGDWAPRLLPSLPA